MTTLYQLVAEHRALAARLAELDMPEEAVRDTLEAEAWPIEQKARACLAVVGELAAQSEMFAERAKQLAEHADRLKKRSAWLREYVLSGMQAADIQEVQGPDFVARRRLNPPRVVIDAESQVPPSYMRTKIVETIDKAQVRADLESGVPLTWAHLERSERLEIK